MNVALFQQKQALERMALLVSGTSVFQFASLSVHKNQQGNLEQRGEDARLACSMQADLGQVSPSLLKLPNELRKPSWASGSQDAVRCPPGSQKAVRLLVSDCLLLRFPASAASSINNVKAGAPERRRVVLWQARRKGRYS